MARSPSSRARVILRAVVAAVRAAGRRGAGAPPAEARLQPMSRSIAALYRFFYDGVLSRLPEPAAIALGQSALRRLPFDRLGSFRLEDPRLAVTLGRVRLPNPLILAAMYYDPRIISRAMGLGFGAVTAKSITVDPRPGHPEPNLVRTRSDAGP